MTTTSTTDPSDTLPFGPVLLGQLEKTLQALLRRTLVGTGLSEPEWVTLRLATMLDGRVDHLGLVAAVADRTKFVGAAEIVDTLTERGLVADGRPTDAGRELVTEVLAASDRSNGSVWRDLSIDDVDATTRVLNEVLRRARELAP
jgi:Helix-turn-helix family